MTNNEKRLLELLVSFVAQMNANDDSDERYTEQCIIDVQTNIMCDENADRLTDDELNYCINHAIECYKT